MCCMLRRAIFGDSVTWSHTKSGQEYTSYLISGFQFDVQLLFIIIASFICCRTFSRAPSASFTPVLFRRCVVITKWQPPFKAERKFPLIHRVILTSIFMKHRFKYGLTSLVKTARCVTGAIRGVWGRAGRKPCLNSSFSTPPLPRGSQFHVCHAGCEQSVFFFFFQGQWGVRNTVLDFCIFEKKDNDCLRSALFLPPCCSP